MAFVYYDPEQLSTGILHFYVDGQNKFDLYRTANGWSLVNYQGGEIPQEVTSAATQLTGSTPTVAGPGSETVTKLTTPSEGDWFGNLIDSRIPDSLGGAATLFASLFGTPVLSELGVLGGASAPLETGAFDMGGSQGVFDSFGNPLYSSPVGDLPWGVNPSLSDIIEELGNFTETPAPVEPGGAMDMFGSMNPSGVGSVFDYVSPGWWDAFKLNPLDAISRALQSSDGKPTTLGRLLSAAIPAGVGAYAASNQSDALKEIAQMQEGRWREAMNMGAPYRQRLPDLYANPAGYLSSPEVQAPVMQGTEALARALSAKVGNPVGSNTALSEIQNYATNQLYGKLGQEKDRLAGFGGLSAYNQAGASGPQNLQALLGANQSNSNVWNALGYGFSNFFNPPKDDIFSLT